jgi:hypothetical protein
VGGFNSGIKELNKHQKAPVACVGERWGAYRTFMGNLRQRDYSEDLGIDERIPLK